MALWIALGAVALVLAAYLFIALMNAETL